MGRRGIPYQGGHMGSTGVGQEAEEGGKLWVRAFLVVFMKRQMRQGKRASDWLAEYFQ